MILWVMYDISSDRSRTKISKLCKQAGLYRVQYSVYLGRIENNEIDTLHVAISDLIDEAVDKVYLFPMSQKELKATIQLGQAFDKDLVNDQVKALFY